MKGFTLGFGRVLIRCGSLWQWHGIGRWQWTGWRGRALTQEERRYWSSACGGRFIRWRPMVTTTFGDAEWSVCPVGPFTVLVRWLQG